MTLRIIKIKKDYHTALKRFEEIFQAKVGAKESDKADVLSILIRAYEKLHFVINAGKYGYT